MSFVPVGTMRYKYRYYRPVLRSVLRKTNLQLQHHDEVIETPFTFSDKERRKWLDLFRVDGDALQLPYELPAMTPPAIRILTGLGANFRYLRHVRTSIRYDTERPTVQPGETYTVRVRLDDVAVLGSHHILAVLGIDLVDGDGVLRLSHQASFMVADVGERNLARVRAHPALDRTDLSSLDLTRWTRETLPPVTEPVSTITFVVPPRMGVQFARLSGDSNFVHIHHITARLLGFRRAFIQGSAIESYAVRYVREFFPKPMEALDITFTRPMFVGSKVEFQCGAGRFWMSDSRGGIIAHGSWT